MDLEHERTAFFFALLAFPFRQEMGDALCAQTAWCEILMERSDGYCCFMRWIAVLCQRSFEVCTSNTGKKLINTHLFECPIELWQVLDHKHFVFGGNRYLSELYLFHWIFCCCKLHSIDFHRYSESIRVFKAFSRRLFSWFENNFRNVVIIS